LDLRDFLDRQASEVVQLHRFALSSIYRLQSFQALVKSQHTRDSSIGQVDCLLQRNFGPAPFGRLPPARVVSTRIWRINCAAIAKN
jgi:hypothetical protein